MNHKPAILFVCLGNICRSPLAEAAFRKAAAEAGLEAHTDSAGTAAYHVGEPPDPRSIATAARYGIDIAHYRGRQIEAADFARFSHILALDHSNLANIRRIAPDGHTAHVSLLMDMVPGREGAAVADPYYDGEEQFEYTWEDVWRAAQALVARLAAAQ
ncbi:low molecular weight phosphotyrosine protein phosphatase [Erythrobacter sp. SDW2]|uniref:low molecular weight protein-tyrosine-phosphatase n=1 Tax=Erythrobacter sp. SDW2 TaxID=2907154 RepID=UPI001F18800B|nr:low molecular weight protein-tyrosine-phosphatase [Erythrobacter sp. SDW2]UIP05962.1 low molecular weight phosphotyrosine protein phosphatase [Erythrobacter sp. SDW2]